MNIYITKSYINDGKLLLPPVSKLSLAQAKVIGNVENRYKNWNHKLNRGHAYSWLEIRKLVHNYLTKPPQIRNHTKVSRSEKELIKYTKSPEKIQVKPSTTKLSNP